MLVEPIAKSPQPAWQEKIGRQLQLKPASAPAPIATFNQPNDDLDPDPPPAAQATRLCLRVFPGL
jgi:hypothetical protein